MTAQRELTAYHEAAHAVMVYHCGGGLNQDGVEIDARQWCGYSIKGRRFEKQDIECAISLAGLMAELIHQGKPFELPGELDIDISAARDRDHVDGNGDEADAFAVILEDHPNATDEELLERFEFQARRSYAVVQLQWGQVERVASALIARGKLSAVEVEGLLRP